LLRDVAKAVVAPTVGKKAIALVAWFQDGTRPVAPTVGKMLAALSAA